MSSVITIASDTGTKMIVVSSDRQLSEEDGKKKSDDKLFYGDNWIMADVGDDNKETRKFYRLLQGHKLDEDFYSALEWKVTDDFLKNKTVREERAWGMIERAVSKRDFYEIDRLNKLIMKRTRDGASTNEFLLVVNKPELQMFHVDEYGNMFLPEGDYFDYICLGSGKENMNEYIESQIRDRKIRVKNISHTVVVHLAPDCVCAAEQIDKNTGLGYDLIIASEREIRNRGDPIREKLSKANYGILDGEASYYDPKPEQQTN